MIADKYRVERTLGRGAMGIVLEAEHRELRTRVALKLLAPEYMRRIDIVERFLREARVCAQLRSEHACRVFDVGRIANGTPYMVMEVLEGRDLQSVLATSGPLAVPVAADYVIQACDALAEAHAAQIVHRDLKPANLFLTRRRDGSEFVKVIDFGVARLIDPDELRITLVDMLLGSPAYMAPEQLRSAQLADARSDIWSLGVILHELVSGRSPFTEDAATELALSAEALPPPRLTGVPDGFAAVVARCLDPAPQRRFQRVEDLVAALRPFVVRSLAATLPMPRPSLVARPEQPTLRTAPIVTPIVASSSLPAITSALPGPRMPAMLPTMRGGPPARHKTSPPRSRRDRRQSVVAGTVGAVVIGLILGLCRCAHDAATRITHAEPAPAAQRVP